MGFTVIRDAQSGLTSLLEWAAERVASDPSVASVVEEARTLQCAALVAQGIASEELSRRGSKQSPEIKQPMAEQPEKSYAQASALASEQLPRYHPVAELAAH